MRCCSSSTRSSCSSSERRPRAIRGVAAATVAVALLAGCGEEPETGGGELGRPEPSALAALAVAGEIDTLDPLYAESRSERLISRQIHEPLTAVIDPPFAATGARRGPARPLRRGSSPTLWRFELRPGVTFQDGTPLSADAVLANVDRWIRSGVAGRLIPELTAVDSPRPGEIRFQLSSPVPDLPARLADARLGLVSRQEIVARGARPIRFGATGSGPYQLRERRDGRILLVRSEDWWGEGAGLGPGINQLEFVLGGDDLVRAERLIAGEVVVADDLGAAAARLVDAAPLVTLVGDADGEGGALLGASAALRGLTSTRPDQSLSALWLTALP